MDAFEEPTGSITPPPPGRVADGTQTNLGAAPRSRATLPPPIPGRARATVPPPIPGRAKTTVPPPIPVRAQATPAEPPRATEPPRNEPPRNEPPRNEPPRNEPPRNEAPRMKAKPTAPPPIPSAAMKARGATASTFAAPRDHLPIDPVVEPPSTISVSPDIDVPIVHDEEPAQQALPPLPRPSQSWLDAAPAPHASADAWSMPGSSNTETSAVADLFSPAAASQPVVQNQLFAASQPVVQNQLFAQSQPVVQSRPVAVPAPNEPPPVLSPSDASMPISFSTDASAPIELPHEPSEASELFMRPTESEVETSASDMDVFAPLPGDEPATNYFERPSYNKRHLAGVGAGAVVLAIVAAIVVRGAMKPSDKPTAPAAPAVAAAPAAPAADTAAPSAAAPVAAPAVAAAPATDVAAAAPTSGRIDVPVTSNPPGAIVTLIENGTPHMIGKTPLFASVDPSKSYDVVIAPAGYPAAMQHLDPKATKQIAVSFDGSTAAVAAPVAAAHVAAAPTTAAHAAPASRHASAGKSKLAPPSLAAVDFGSTPAPAHHAHETHVAAAEPTSSSHAAKVAAGHGVLMVASKPPCELVIDGERTHLETPQRSIDLAPGAHSVTFVNAKMGVNKTVSINVVANKPTKLIRDFTH